MTERSPRFLNQCWVSPLKQLYSKTVQVYGSTKVGSEDIKILYNFLLMAGPILESVNAPFLLAFFYCLSVTPIHILTGFHLPLDLVIVEVHRSA